MFASVCNTATCVSSQLLRYLVLHQLLQLLLQLRVTYKYKSGGVPAVDYHGSHPERLNLQDVLFCGGPTWGFYRKCPEFTNGRGSPEESVFKSWCIWKRYQTWNWQTPTSCVFILSQSGLWSRSRHRLGTWRPAQSAGGREGGGEEEEEVLEPALLLPQLPPTAPTVTLCIRGWIKKTLVVSF